MLPARLQRPLRACSRSSSVAARCYATRSKATTNASPYANLSALKTASTPAKKTAPTSIPTSVPTPAPKPAASRPSTAPPNTTAQPERAAPATPTVKPIGRDSPATITPKRAEPSRSQKTAPKTRPPLDPKSEEYRKEYNSLTRRWTAGLIAMPILLVTSYYLFDRLILGHEKKELHHVENLNGPEESSIKTL